MTKNNDYSVDILNSLDQQRTVWFEPWAENIEIASHTVLHVIYSPPKKNAICIEYRESEIIIHGMLGSSLKAMQDGTVVWESY